MSGPNGIIKIIQWTCVFTLSLFAAQATRGQAMSSAREAEPPQSVPQVQVVTEDEQGLDVSIHLDAVDMQLVDTPINDFLLASWRRAVYYGEPGDPMIPVIRRMFIAPQEAEISVSVEPGQATVYNLAQEGYKTTLMPRQAPVEDPDDLRTPPFYYTPEAYSIDADLPATRAGIEELGVYRGRRICMVEVRPVAYNAARNTLTIWSDMRVHLSFTGGYQPENLPVWRPLGEELLNPPPVDMRGSLNYLIVTPPGFYESTPLTQLAAAKTARGYNVLVYNVPVGTTHTQIQSYIKSLWGTANAPDFILIAADTPCYFDVSNESNYTMLPSTYWEIPNFLGGGNRHAPTDLYYACMDSGDDWFPDIPIGRMPARDVTEMQTMIDRTLFIMNGAFADVNYLKRAAFMAGTDYSSGDQAAHEYVITTHLAPRGFTSYRLYSSLGSTTQDMINAFNDGVLYSVYYGHSDYASWWEPDQGFGLDEINALENYNEYPYVLNITCRTACYDHPWQDISTVGEGWMRASNGGNPTGSVIFIGATRQIYWYVGSVWIEAQSLEMSFFDKIYFDEIEQVGPILQATMAALITEYGATVKIRDYVEMYHVLGDPSLKIAEPAGFLMSVDPTEIVQCMPAGPAVYTIEVDPEPGFSSTVHLAAQGVPVGATAQFSTNDAVPPFTSSLTISNVPAGDHNIRINGTATGGIVQTLDVQAHYSSGPPSTAPSLIYPVGESDVPLTPMMMWSAVSGAIGYEIQIAADYMFTNIIYEASSADTSHTVAEPLPDASTLFWHCRAVNACGSGSWSVLAGFTTMSVPTYFTEVFAGETFDLQNKRIEFTPIAGGHYYSMCVSSASALPTDPTGGTDVTSVVGNDSYAIVAPSQSVAFYRADYTNFFVNANGNITFGQADSTYNETLATHFAKKRIAGVFDDLKPHVGGTVSWKETADRVAVTFDSVPGYGFTGTVTFQIEIFFDGTLRITWLGVNSTSCIVGLSAGNGVPADYEEMDLSAGEACDDPCYGDINGDNLINLDDLAQLLGHYGQTGASYEDGDLNGDGTINLDDLAGLLGVYGHPCP